MAAPLIVNAATAADTQALAERLGRLLAAGDVLALLGPLGAGKTTFIQGLARVLDAIEIRVHQRNAARMFVDQRERRTGDVPVGRHVQPARQALDERRLARAQRAGQRQHVARGQEAAEAFGDRLRVGGGRRVQDQRRGQRRAQSLIFSK